MKKKNFSKEIILMVLVVLTITSLSIEYFVISYDQTNITSTVNITNSVPEILEVRINNNGNIDLTEGTTRIVECNITVRDFNGNADINYLNATFFSTDFSTRDAILSNNTNYFLETPQCTNTTISSDTAIYTCNFEVYYYAYNGTWECNASVTDMADYLEGNGANNGIINPLYAINVTDLIDYGNLAVGDTSTGSETANITNFGNMPINITVFGYGGYEFVTGNNLAFICEQGNISIENQRYGIVDNIWDSLTSLSSSSTAISGLTIQNQHTDIPVVNSTYWRLYVPPNPFGQCNGTIVFEAELP